MTGERPQGKTHLMTACEQGRTLEAKIILQKKPHSISSRDKHGKTALHYCAESGAQACAQLLLGGVDRTLLDAPDAEGFTPLHLAVISGNKAVAKLLLRAGADPDSVDKERHSVVHWAAVCGDVESLELLLNQGASPSTPDILGAYPIHYAAQMCGAHSLNGKDPETGLNTLRKLVQKGASIQCRDKDGREPLLWAASAGSSEAVLVLFTAGANVATSDKDGLTALHCASSRGHTGCVETLITLCGARVDAGDHIGCSPLFYSAAQGQADCSQVLLKHGSDPNRQDNKGRTPAHCAAVKGRLEILRILDSNGADLWIRNSRGNLPLHEAVVSGRKDLVQWLLQQCPRAVNATNISGRTPLHIAAQRNNVEMCEVLIDYGAFINPLMVNAKGFLMTPLDASVYQGNQRCAKYLQLHGAVPATKVLENNEINRNLLFSLGNYAYNQKERSDEEPSSSVLFEQSKDALQPATVRDTQTRTIRGGQQPPIPQPANVPPESELTNVTSEAAAADASVHIHLTRDDLWSLWESLMQELTSEMSGSEISQGSEKKPKPDRRTSEVRQLKPILTNVYLRRESGRSQVIAGESILDRGADQDAVATRSVSEDTKLRYPKKITDDFKTTLPRVSEAEKSKSTEEDRHTSGNVSGMDAKEAKQEDPKTDFFIQNYQTDSVGSDTEHVSPGFGSKPTRLRKRRSDGKSWGKEPEESETSSGHRQEQREPNPYLKRYLQRQARAAEMRKYLESQSIQNEISVEEIRRSKQQISENLSDIKESKDYRKPSSKYSYTEQKSPSSKKDRKYLSMSSENLPAAVPSKLSRSHRSKTSSTLNLDKEDLRVSTHRRHSKDHKHKCDCMRNIKSTKGKTEKASWHSEECRLKRRHGMESPKRSGRKKHETSPTHAMSRKGSKQFLEVPSQPSAAASDERSEDIPGAEELESILHHHYYHHHHHHHHHHRHSTPEQEKIASEDSHLLESHRHPTPEREKILSEDNHHLERHLKHKKHFHRKKSRTKMDSIYRREKLSERNTFSDGEYEQQTDDYFYSGNDISRSKSEMSGFPWYSTRDVLTQSPVPEVSEKESNEIVDENESKTEVDAQTTKYHKKDNVQRSKKATKDSQSKVSETLSGMKEKSDDSTTEEIHPETKIDSVGEESAKKVPPELSEKKRRTPDIKSSSRKKYDRNPYKVIKNIKRASPRREARKPGKPPLRAAQSFSETLSQKTKVIPLKQKSQSARIEKELPEIKVFSAEGNETEVFIREEFNLDKLSETIESTNIPIDVRDQSLMELENVEKTDTTKHRIKNEISKDTDDVSAALVENFTDNKEFTEGKERDEIEGTAGKGEDVDREKSTRKRSAIIKQETPIGKGEDIDQEKSYRKQSAIMKEETAIETGEDINRAKTYRKQSVIMKEEIPIEIVEDTDQEKSYRKQSAIMKEIPIETGEDINRKKSYRKKSAIMKQETPTEKSEDIDQVNRKQSAIIKQETPREKGEDTDQENSYRKQSAIIKQETPREKGEDIDQENSYRKQSAIIKQETPREKVEDIDLENSYRKQSAVIQQETLVEDKHRSEDLESSAMHIKSNVAVLDSESESGDDDEPDEILYRDDSYDPTNIAEEGTTQLEDEIVHPLDGRKSRLNIISKVDVSGEYSHPDNSSQNDENLNNANTLNIEIEKLSETKEVLKEENLKVSDPIMLDVPGKHDHENSVSNEENDDKSCSLNVDSGNENGSDEDTSMDTIQKAKSADSTNKIENDSLNQEFPEESDLIVNIIQQNSIKSLDEPKDFVPIIEEAGHEKKKEIQNIDTSYLNVKQLDETEWEEVENKPDLSETNKELEDIEAYEKLEKEIQLLKEEAQFRNGKEKIKEQTDEIKISKNQADDTDKEIDIELVEETARDHVMQIIQKAESEIQKQFGDDALIFRDSDTKIDEDSFLQSHDFDPKPIVELKITDSTPNNDEPRNEEHFSDPESTSEAETKFDTDSEEVKPEPDLDVQLLSETESMILHDETSAATVEMVPSIKMIQSEKTFVIDRQEAKDGEKKDHPYRQDLGSNDAKSIHETDKRYLESDTRAVQDLEARVNSKSRLEGNHGSDLCENESKNRENLNFDVKQGKTADDMNQKKEENAKEKDFVAAPKKHIHEETPNGYPSKHAVKTSEEEHKQNGKIKKRSKMDIFKKPKHSSKSQQTIETHDSNEIDAATTDSKSKMFPSAEVQTDISGETKMFEIGVNVEAEVGNLIGFNRSISVQTSDYDSGVAAVLEKSQKHKRKSIPNIDTRKTISVQTEDSDLRKQTILEHADEIKQAIRMANINDISGKSKTLSKHILEIPQMEQQDMHKDKCTSVTSDMINRSPERQNPSAVFYKATPKIVTQESPKKGNVGAMFYTTSSMKDKNGGNSRSSPNLYAVAENSDNFRFRQTETRRNVARSTIRDRSLESEKAVAIANSAFRRLNSKGELTVFNSSLITVPHSTVALIESRPACQRREHSNLEKSGFLWVHFGSGSSPISTLKKRPNFTSQKVNRESKLIQDNSTNISNRDTRERRANVSKNLTSNRGSKSGELQTETNASISSRNKSEKAIYKSSPRKSNSVLNEALHVSSKVLTNKKTKNLDVCKANEEKQPGIKSRIPHKYTESDSKKKSGNEEMHHVGKYERSQVRKERDYLRKKVPEARETEESPRKAIPRLCREYSYVKSSDDVSIDSKNSKTPRNTEVKKGSFPTQSSDNSINLKDRKEIKSKISQKKREQHPESRLNEDEHRSRQHTTENVDSELAQEEKRKNGIKKEHREEHLHEYSTEDVKRGTQFDAENMLDIDVGRAQAKKSKQNAKSKAMHREASSDKSDKEECIPTLDQDTRDNLVVEKETIHKRKTKHDTKRKQMQREASSDKSDKEELLIPAEAGTKFSLGIENQMTSKRKKSHDTKQKEVHRAESSDKSDRDETEIQKSPPKKTALNAESEANKRKKKERKEKHEACLDKSDDEILSPKQSKTKDGLREDNEKKHRQKKTHDESQFKATSDKANKEEPRVPQKSKTNLPVYDDNIPKESNFLKSSSKKKKDSISKSKNEHLDEIEISSPRRSEFETSERAKDIDTSKHDDRSFQTQEHGTEKEKSLKNKGKRSPRKTGKTGSRTHDEGSSTGRTKGSPTKEEQTDENRIGNAEEYEDRYDHLGSRENESSNLNPNDGPYRMSPRLSETAKSSSLDEGDVKLVIERKTNPDFSIKIKMSDKRKKSRKAKDTSKNADFSSTQCESDQSYIKDSGYISTTESIHRHRRSITIDLGHTKAKINAGVKEATADEEEENGYGEETETSEFCLPEVNEDKTVAKDEDEDEKENSQSSSHDALQSKLPILNSHRRRSNSLVLTSYTRTPRRNSISNGLQDGSSEMQEENSTSETKRNLKDKNSTRQVGNGAEKGSRKLTRSGSNIPIYRAHSDGNLQEVGKPSPRLSQSLSTPAIPEMSDDNFFLSHEQKMDRIAEHSSSSSDIPSDVNKFQSQSLEDLKLPSILLSKPHETTFAGRASTKGTYPIISPRGKPGRSSIYRSPIRSRHVSPDLSLKLPLLQTPVRCRCSIEPYDFWDGRRTKSAVDCVANLHFLSEEELSQFDSRLFAASGTSYSSGLRKKIQTPTGYKAIRTQTLKSSKPGRKSAESVTFHVDHARERNSFKLPTEKLKKNKKFKVVFTIGKSEGKDKDKKSGDKKS